MRLHGLGLAVLLGQVALQGFALHFVRLLLLLHRRAMLLQRAVLGLQRQQGLFAVLHGSLGLGQGGGQAHHFLLGLCMGFLLGLAGLLQAAHFALQVLHLLLVLACLLLLMPAAGSESHLAILSLFWGVAIMIIGLGMQVKVLALAPDATDVAMSLFSGIFNLGIGAGALVGNQVILHVSMSAIGYLGAIPALVALVWSVLIFRKWPVALEEQGQHG